MRRNWRHHRSRARGFSFLEILAALAIVSAIAAVAVPWTFGWLGGRELDNAEDQLAMQLVMARAAAREEGRPVEVVATVGVGRSTIQARWMQDVLEGDDPRRSTESDRPAASDAIAANWAEMDLPEGVELWLDDDMPRDASDDASDDMQDDAWTDDSEAAARSDADAAIEAMDAADGAAARPAQVLAIFLPDGTAIVAPVLMLRTDAGLRRALQIDRVTGRPRAADEPKQPERPVVRPDFDVPADTNG
ncbi:MAG: pilus assembly FimT family protein [Phycisphaerales bacterium]